MQFDIHNSISAREVSDGKDVSDSEKSICMNLARYEHTGTYTVCNVSGGGYKLVRDGQKLFQNLHHSGRSGVRGRGER